MLSSSTPLPKPLDPPKPLLKPLHRCQLLLVRNGLPQPSRLKSLPESRIRNTKRLKINACSASAPASTSTSTTISASAPPASSSNSAELQEVQSESAQQLFEEWRESERERMSNLAELERKAKLQLDRQLIMASEWSRKLLTMRGKLKGTEWDPENSHRIAYSDFRKLLDSNLVHYMEYADYGQKVSVILPYYKDEKEAGTAGAPEKGIVFRRHMVDRMPVDCWNDVWRKLHQQLVNVDVYNVDRVPAEVYSTLAIAVVWFMRFALAIVLYLWIDSMARPIYTKPIPFIGSARQTKRQPLEQRNALGSLGKSR